MFEVQGKEAGQLPGPGAELVGQVELASAKASGGRRGWGWKGLDFDLWWRSLCVVLLCLLWWSWL